MFLAHFTSIIYKCLISKIDCPDKPLQPRLILVGKARSLISSGLPERGFRRQPYSQTLDEAVKACQGQTLAYYEQC